MCEKSKGVYDMNCKACCVRLLKSVGDSKRRFLSMLEVIRMSTKNVDVEKLKDEFDHAMYRR